MSIVESDRRSWARGVALAAVLLALGSLALAWLARRPPPPTTTQPPSTATPTTALTTPMTPTESPTTIASPVPTPIAPQLGDFRLYLVATTGRLAGYLDGRTGLFVERRLSTPSDVSDIVRLDGGRIVLLGASAHIVDADLARPAEPIPHGLTNVYVVRPGENERLWVMQQPRADGSPMFELVEIDLSGQVLSRAPSSTAFRWPVWLQGREVLIAAGGRIYLRNVSTGTTRVYAIGELDHAETRRVVWRSCPTIETCTNYVGTAANPTLFSFTEPYYLNQHPFSPDGNYFLLGTAEDAYLVDLRTGVRRPLGRGVIDAQTWSPDSRWVFLKDAAVGVRAIETAGDREVAFELPTAGRAIIAA